MNELIDQYLFHLKEEQAAKKARIALADQIADKLGRPEEGQQTHTVDGWLITVKQPVNRKVLDWDAFDRACAGAAHSPCRVKRELDVTGLRWFEQHDSDRYLEIAKTIESKPGQVSLAIKESSK